MSSESRRALPVAVGCLVALAVPAVGQDLRGLAPDSWAYPVADALLLRHPELGGHLWLGNRPWREFEVDSLVARARIGRSDTGVTSGWIDLLAGLSPDSGSDPGPVSYQNVLSARLALDGREQDATFEPPFETPVFDDDRGEPRARGILEHEFALQFERRFALAWRYVVDSNIRNDPTRRTVLGLRGRDAAFEVLDAYAVLRAGPVWATAGRQALSLGPGRASAIFVSESIPALDHVRLELHADPIRFTSLFASLSRERPNRQLDDTGDTIEGSDPADGPPVPFDVTRFLYLHRFDWRVVDHLQIAISEAALVTGIDRGFEPRFLNPLIPFFATQEEDDEVDAGNVNIVVDLQGVYTGLPRSRLYGEVFVQELFIDDSKRDSIGNQLAWRVGGEWGDPLGWTGGSVGAEYSRVDVFTYLHRGLNTNWSTFGVPLGSTLGPDSDQVLVWTDYWPTTTVRLTADLLHRRSGERNIRTLESVLVAGNPDFPSGVVQRERRIGLEARGLLVDGALEGRVRVDHRNVEGIANDRGRDGSFWEARLGLTYHFRF